MKYFGLCTCLALGGFVAAGIPSATAQTGPPRQEFEAVSVKAAPATARGYGVQPGPGGLRLSNCTLKQIVAEAYHVYDFQVTGGPKWIDSDRFDINARTPGDAHATSEALRAMLRSMLEDRFQLGAHVEDREMSVFAIQQGKAGLRFEHSKDPDQPPFFRVYQRRQITAQRSPLEYLTDALSQLLGRPVVDAPGLKASSITSSSGRPMSSRRPRPKTR
jgi:uncharacterized protein (TIGR03435 family)